MTFVVAGKSRLIGESTRLQQFFFPRTTEGISARRDDRREGRRFPEARLGNLLPALTWLPRMSPSDAQQAALESLERLGGKPVVLREQPQLSNHAKIHVAAADEHAHVLTYNPTAASQLPYLVCFQCGLAARALRSARDERFNVASTPETYGRVQRLVREKKTIPEDMVAT